MKKNQILFDFKTKIERRFRPWIMLRASFTIWYLKKIIYIEACFRL